MGVADIIPGVSGGTVALISGIYEHLIAAISSVKLSHVRDALVLPLAIAPSARNKEIAKAGWQNITGIPWNFLLPLAAGIIGGVFSMSRIIPRLMNEHPFYLYSFFFGLIIFSITIPFRHVHKKPVDLGLTAVFTAVTYVLLNIPGQVGVELQVAPQTLTGTPGVFFFSGAVAVCAMILPGVSGAYLLVMLGQYKKVLHALHEHDFILLGALAAGMAAGLFTFVRLIRYLLFRHHSRTMAALTGVMAGSIFKIWPFSYSARSGAYEFIVFFALSAGGALFLYLLEKLARYVGDPEPPV